MTRIDWVFICFCFLCVATFFVEVATMEDRGEVTLSVTISAIRASSEGHLIEFNPNNFGDSIQTRDASAYELLKDKLGKAVKIRAQRRTGFLGLMKEHIFIAIAP